MDTTDTPLSKLTPRLRAEMRMTRYLGRDFRGEDFRAAALGLPLIFDFLTMTCVPSEPFTWSDFDANEYVSLVLDLEDDEALFLRALLVEARVFFAYLCDAGEIGAADADRIDADLEGCALRLSAARSG